MGGWIIRKERTFKKSVKSRIVIHSRLCWVVRIKNQPTLFWNNCWNSNKKDFHLVKKSNEIKWQKPCSSSLAWSIVHSTGRTRKSVRPSSRSNKKQKKRSWPAVSSDDDGRIRGVRSDRADKILLCVCVTVAANGRVTPVNSLIITWLGSSSSQQPAARRAEMTNARTAKKSRKENIPSLYVPDYI